MRQVIVGPSNSGKSENAERLLLGLARTKIGYIATLPYLHHTAARINRHKARRGAQWITFEMVDSAEECLRLIEDAIRRCQYLLLDGLSILVWRISVIHGELDFSCANRFLDRLDWLLKSSDNNWIIVDCDMPYADLGDQDPFNVLMRAYQHKLICQCC